MFLFLFLLPECLWWLLEVSGNPCPKGTSWDSYPESLLHPGGSFQLHWIAFQQWPDGQRGRYKAKEGCETKQQRRLTLFLSFLLASAVGHWKGGTLALLQWQLSGSFRPRQEPSWSKDFWGDHQHFSSGATVKPLWSHCEVASQAYSRRG